MSERYSASPVYFSLLPTSGAPEEVSSDMGNFVGFDNWQVMI